MAKLLSALLGVAILVGPVVAAEPADMLNPPATPAPSPMDGPLVDVGADGGAAPRLIIGVEYVLWWLREGRLPATLTTSSPASRGLLGQPGTQILYGDDRLETRHGDRFNGIRPSVEYWFDDSLGIEGRAFFLERDSTHFKDVSDGSTLLARPYFLPNGTPASYIVAGPTPDGPRNGGFVGYSRIELFGEEANLVAPLLDADGVRLDALGGARFLQMRDRTDLTATGWALPQQTTLFGLEDHYRADNAYYGGQVGLRGELSRGGWFVNMRSLVGLGANLEEVQTIGYTLYQTPTERLVANNGLTVQPGNAGTFDRTAVNLVSEVGFNVGYRFTSHIQAFAGYTFLLWASPVRSGDQVELVVNTNPAAPPSVPFKSDLFWAQGLNAGVAFSW